MRTLIFGVRGQLGKDVAAVFGAEGPTIGWDLPETDITDGAAVRNAVQEFRPNLVINAAAYTDVERAEQDREAAFRVNETSALYVAEAAAMLDAVVVYFSTDFVFDGAQTTPYEPDDPVHPHGVYAESKAAGEAATRAANRSHFIVRTAWLYGPGGNNFVEKILRAAMSRPTLRVVHDEVGSPTHTLDLAEAVRALVKTSAYGVYHAVNEGACSRFEFARSILQLAERAVAVEPCSSSEFPTHAPRPKYSVLSNARLASVAGHTMRPWAEALRHYMRRRDTAL